MHVKKEGMHTYWHPTREDIVIAIAIAIVGGWSLFLRNLDLDLSIKTLRPVPQPTPGALPNSM